MADSNETPQETPDGQSVSNSDPSTKEDNQTADSPDPTPSTDKEPSQTSEPTPQEPATENPPPTESLPDTTSGEDDPAVYNGVMSEEDQTIVANKMAAFPALPQLTSSNTAIRVTASEMEVTELKVKVICQEKRILALQMELKAAELQVQAKEKIDAKKTRLVELLDNKLSAVEKRNVKLLDMLETMLREKDGNTNRLKEATKNMADLSQRLVESERIKSEVLRINAELRKMLDNLESKGTQIAKLAKEKVLKYKDENTQMQQELSDLRSEPSKAEGANDGAAKEANTELHPPSAVDLSATSCVDQWNKISDLQHQITSALASVDTASPDSLQKSIQAASDANRALGESVQEAKTRTEEGMSALSVENEQLRALIEEFDVTRRRLEKSDEASRDQLLEQGKSATAKDKEIEELKDELCRLKGAIGQLIGSK